MTTPPVLVVAWITTVVAVFAALAVWVRTQRLRRAEFIRTYVFPRGLFERLAKRRPELGLKQDQLVARGLRQFFLAHLNSNFSFVSMPSQVADDLWHEFILYTRNYEQFCRGAFGRFLHHTPAVVLDSGEQNNRGLRRTWWQTCKEEGINPKQPTRLPLLFALDTKLGIADGFHYAADCAELQRGQHGTVYCGGDLGAGSSSDGCGGGNDSSSSVDSSGCGGSSCDGGGCGGGGD